MAATAGAIKAGRAFVELFADNSKLNRDLRLAENSVKRFGMRVAAISAAAFAASAAIVGGLAVATKQFIAFGGQLDDMSQRTGLGAGMLSELAHAATMSGTSLETLERGLIAMNKQMKPGDGRSAAERFNAIAAELAAIEDPAKRAQAAMKHFGKAGAELSPMFATLAAARKQAQTFGLVIDEKDIAVAASLGDSLDILWSVVKRAAFAIGSALGPTLIKMTQALVRGLVAVTKWIDANREWTVSIAKAATGLSWLGEAFDGVLDALSAGDLRLAGQIAMKQLQVVFKQGANSLMEIWQGITEPVVETTVSLMNTISSIFIDGFAAVQQIFAKALKAIVSGIDQLTARLNQAAGALGIDLNLPQAAGFLPDQTAAIEAARKAMQAALSASAAQARSGREGERADAARQRNEELQKLVNERDDLIRKAAEAAKQAGEDFTLPIQERQAEAIRTSRVQAGTFSGAAVAQLNVQSVQDRQLSELQDMNEQMAKVRREVEELNERMAA